MLPICLDWFWKQNFEVFFCFVIKVLSISLSSFSLHRDINWTVGRHRSPDLWSDLLLSFQRLILAFIKNISAETSGETPDTFTEANRPRCSGSWTFGWVLNSGFVFSFRCWSFTENRNHHCYVAAGENTNICFGFYGRGLGPKKNYFEFWLFIF